MKFGARFPISEIGTDPVVIRDFAQAVEGAGYDYLYFPEHVTGASPARFGEPPYSFRPENSGVTYTYETQWHEPLTFLSYISAITTRIKFVPVVVYLSQRQTVLVAKQIAELDILSGGRFQPNFGTGWNFTEHEALGTDWETRTQRIEEQMRVLKMLWSEPLVTFDGDFHHLDRVGINPLPTSGVLPMWYAGSARNVVLKRAVNFCDGWYALLIPPEEPRMAMERLQRHLRAAGKDPSQFSVIGLAANRAPGARISGSSAGVEHWLDRAKLWAELGATHLSVSSMGATVQESLKMTIETKKILDSEIGANDS